MKLKWKAKLGEEDLTESIVNMQNNSFTFTEVILLIFLTLSKNGFKLLVGFNQAPTKGHVFCLGIVSPIHKHWYFMP